MVGRRKRSAGRGERCGGRDCRNGEGSASECDDHRASPAAAAHDIFLLCYGLLLSCRAGHGLMETCVSSLSEGGRRC